MSEQTEKFYVFSQELFLKIREYLDSKPFVETEFFMSGYFEKEYSEKEYLRKNFMDALINYFITKCPRKEIKGFIDDINNGGVTIFIGREKKKNEE